MKKGQLSLPQMVGALVLVVMIIILGVFVLTGRFGVFEKLTRTTANQDLTELRAKYGTCRPAPAAEEAFIADVEELQPDSDGVVNTAAVRGIYLRMIKACAALPPSTCETDPDAGTYNSIFYGCRQA